MTKDISFILEGGEQQSNNYLASAQYERNAGKAALKQSKMSAWAKGITGAGSIAFMGYSGGLWGGGGNTPGTAAMLSESPSVNNWLTTMPLQ
jgi:hypothetical protein